ncbi:MAG TPA: hypothetical protein VFZ12_04365 [Dehalococcoidia bacterium]|nr:hypothetical protein [Dehalococcoidia bacterium]
MVMANIRAGLYINTENCQILSVARETDLRERPAKWELLADDPRTGLLEARQLAMEGGYTTDPRQVDWARMYEGSLKNLDTLEALDKAQRLADEADELSTREATGVLVTARRYLAETPAIAAATVAAAALLAAEMTGYTSFV